MAAILHTIFSNAFSWLKMLEFSIEMSLKFVAKHPIVYETALVQAMAWRWTGDKPLFELIMDWFTLLPHMHHSALTHWGRVMHICFGKLNIMVSDSGLLHGQYQAIIWTNVGILLIWPLGTNFSEILMKIITFSFKKMHLKVSTKRCPFCLGLKVFTS